MTVDDLFDRYKATFTGGGDPDPGPYLDQLEGLERRELAALIDGFLAAMPARPYDAERLAGTPAGDLTRRVLATVREEGAAETWLTLLPRARNEARLLRSQVVERLAQRLGFAGREEKVGVYYHRMEHGQLDPQKVSERVIAALGDVLGVPHQRLRAAGERLGQPVALRGPAVFARKSRPNEEPQWPDARVPSDRLGGEHDEIDALFTGG